MIVIPAIDVRGGRAVRLLRGNPEEETAYDDDPVNVAVRFQTEGARRLHVIDLDAALEQGDNRDTIRDICRSVVCPVQVGGGIRTLEDIQREHILMVLERTAWRVSGEQGAAELLGMKPTTLEARMKRLGIKRTE